MSLSIAIWNINGIRNKDAIIEKMIERVDSDILCFSETKLSQAEIPSISSLDAVYSNVYYNFCQTSRGYSGTSVYSKIPAVFRYPTPEFDKEGRVIILEFNTFILVHVYTPNSGRKLNRIQYRVEEWDPLFWNMVQELKSTTNKKVVVCGDLNVIPDNRFIWSPKPNLKAAGCTKLEQDSFNAHLNECNMKLVYAPVPSLYKGINGKTCQINTTSGQYGDYSFWSTYGTCREDNKGWLLDHFVIPNDTPSKNKLISAYKFYPEIHGSDHCPIKATFKIKD